MNYQIDERIDERIRRDLSSLTAPRSPDAVMAGIAVEIRSRPKRTSRLRVAIAAVAAVAAVVIAVVGSGTLVEYRSSAGRSVATSSAVSAGERTAGASQSSSITTKVESSSWSAAKWPAVIDGPFGRSDTSGYDRQPARRLSDFPDLDGPFVEQYLGGPAERLYPGLAGPEALAKISDLVILGRPLAFSRPYFNSSGGWFWRTELVGEVDGLTATDGIYQDVLMSVDEVLGTNLPGGFEPGLIEITVNAGQAVVSLDRDVSVNPSYGSGQLSPGRYLVRERPATDLALEQSVILFLRYQDLIRWSGERYETVSALMPAHPLYFAFAIDGDMATSLSGETDSWNSSVDKLRQFAEEIGRDQRSSRPDARVHPLRPSHGSQEQPLPSPTLCPDRTVGNNEPSVPTLAEFVDSTDAVIIGRAGTRSRELAVLDGGLVQLAREVLVEQGLRGDLKGGTLIQVGESADANPACRLIVDGKGPLEPGGQYVLFLGADRTGFAIVGGPEGRLAIRDGKVDDNDWPELKGLTIPELPRYVSGG